MIGKILAQFLGNIDEEDSIISNDTAVENQNYEFLSEFEDGEWIIINIQGVENQAFASPEVDPLENLLIEHPSMSVYQLRHQGNDEDNSSSDEEEVDSPRPVPIVRHVSWRLAAWGIPMPCGAHLLSVQRARANAEHRKWSRSALHRQNLVKTRFMPTERRHGHYKQPSQRLHNY